MAESLSKTRRRILALLSCGVLGLVPALANCDSGPAYGPGPTDCEATPPSCTSNSYCIDVCGSGSYCDIPASSDAGVGQCRLPQP